ncbi:MAG: endo-1,4-beta-xylanase [Beijerinckiaceae bacterium]|nr:endo-1,4-beta-xylanase [Beijerinckiaceae bacterium]
MHQPTRRRLLQTGGAAVALAAAGFEARAMPGEGLAQIAARAGITFGAAAARETLTDTGYRRLYTQETRSITTDYALKFDALRPSESEFRFEGADALIAFATENGLQKRGHTLIWNENAPDWLKAKSKAEKARVFDEHIDKVTERYVGKIDVWDVVNEPFWPGHRLPGGYRQGPWYDTFGPDYVKRALIRVGKIDKTVKIAINEAHTERSDELGQANRKGMLRLIDEVQHAGAPLHAIGLQGHLQPQFPFDDDGYVAFLQDIAARKLEIHITEMDVDDTSFTSSIADRDRDVAARVYAYLSKVLAVPQVTMLSTWELSDLYSWYRDPDILKKAAIRRLPRPLPFDDRMERKPMWKAIAQALAERKAG